jgi:hypothetical protein
MMITLGLLAASTASADRDPWADPETDRSTAADTAATIELVVLRLDSEYVGTTLTYVVRPVLLFRGGDTTEDLRVLAQGIAAHKRANASAWTRWRRVGTTIERHHGGRWARLRGEQVAPLPARFLLDGKYRNESYAVNNTSAYAQWSDLRFDRQGRFESGGGMGGSSSKVGVRHEAAKQVGRYEITGYVLTLRHDDGRLEQRMIACDAAKPERIYVDGKPYRK